MSQRYHHRLLFIVLAVLALAGPSAWAGHYGGDPRDGGGYRSANGPRASGPDGRSYAGDPRDGLPASVRRIQRETGGQVLKAQPYERDGREIYRVKVLTPQGRIRVYEDDPSMLRGARRGPATIYEREPLPEPLTSPPRDGRASSRRDAPASYQQRFQQQQPYPQPPPRGHRRSG